MRRFISVLLALLLCLGLSGCGGKTQEAAPFGPVENQTDDQSDEQTDARTDDQTENEIDFPDDLAAFFSENEIEGLEFWIEEPVELADFNGHDEIAGHFGAVEYLGTGYRAVTDEDGWNASRPDVFVSYIITNYPDYSSPGLAVTTIWITDPTVTVYGLTVDSPLSEWDAVMREMGYAVIDPYFRSNPGAYRRAEKGGLSFFYGDGQICIDAEVTNEQGIVF